MAAPVVKTPSEIEAMRVAGRIAARVLRQASKLVEPGVSTRDLDERVGELIRDHGATSAFLGYRGFPANCCISVNEAVIHGIGNQRRLGIGDLVKLDIGVKYNGFIGDTAATVACGGCSSEAQKLMDVTAAALYKGISSARAGKRISAVGAAVWDSVKPSGFGVVREFCGHGLGRKVHEEPQVPNYVDPRCRQRFKAGWTVAIEPMVTLADPKVELLADGWTVVTRDRQITAHFEHTVLITEGEPEILTCDEDGLWY